MVRLKHVSVLRRYLCSTETGTVLPSGSRLLSNVLFGVLFEWLPLFLLIEEKVAGDELQTGARTSRPSRWLGTITSDHVPTSFLRLFLYLPGKGLFVARLIFFGFVISHIALQNHEKVARKQSNARMQSKHKIIQAKQVLNVDFLHLAHYTNAVK